MRAPIQARSPFKSQRSRQTPPTPLTASDYRKKLDQHLTEATDWTSKLAKVFDAMGPPIGKKLGADPHAIVKQIAQAAKYIGAVPVSGTGWTGQQLTVFGTDTLRIAVRPELNNLRSVLVEDTQLPGFKLLIQEGAKGTIEARQILFRQDHLTVTWRKAKDNGVTSKVVVADDVLPFGTVHRTKVNGQVIEEHVDEFMGQPVRLQFKSPTWVNQKLKPGNFVIEPLLMGNDPAYMKGIGQELANQLGKKVFISLGNELTTLRPNKP